MKIAFYINLCMFLTGGCRWGLGIVWGLPNAKEGHEGCLPFMKFKFESVVKRTKSRKKQQKESGVGGIFSRF